MKDLNKIQEFFSKSLEEGEQLDIIDFAKVVKAVHKTGHPVTVLLTPKWNEIEVLTGMGAPDDMLRDLSNAVSSLGYGRNDIIIAGDSSNLSRREYSDIRRVNGGHKDYFEEATKDEENEFHKKLDKLVHKTFGHSSDEKKKMNENETPEFKAQTALVDHPNYDKLVDILTANGFEVQGKPYTDQTGRRYVDGLWNVVKWHHVDDSGNKSGQPASYKDINSALKQAGITGIVAKPSPTFKFRLTLDKQGLEEAKIRKAHGQKISKELFAKLKGKVINYKGTEYKVVDADEAVIKLTPVEPGGRGKTINLNQFNLGGIVYEVLETIKLGQQLNEELCEKGKRYIKARQAAGEKSSAYLSGRAVRVCKGQIEWPKKGKKK